MAEARFALIAGGEVAVTFIFDESSTIDDVQRMIAALRSPHEIVEYFDSSISKNWRYDGTTFTPPPLG